MDPLHPAAVITAGPSVEPVTVAELKLHSRIDTDAEDSLIEECIAAAREAYENYTSRVLVTSTVKQFYDAVPSGREIVLLRGPVSAISAVKYLDEDGAEQTFASSNYATALTRTPGRIWLKDDADWPDVGSFPSCFWVEFEAGHGDAASDCPATARAAVRMLAAHFYENRLPLNIGNIVNELPFSLKHLLEQDRLFLI